MEDFKRTLALNVVNHTTKFENSAVGYHCLVCGKFYAEGLYTIEGRDTDSRELFLLCHNEKVTCCGREVFMPVIFFTQEPACDFLKNILKHVLNTTPVAKKEFIEVHFRSEHNLTLH